MKTPNFSTMTVDALVSARKTIDALLGKRVPTERKELEERLSALNEFFGGESRGRKAKSKSRRSTKGRRVPPKYRSPNGETWAGRGARPRWLTAAIKAGSDQEDFAIGAGGRRKTRSKKTAQRGAAKRGTAKRGTAKRKAGRSAKEKVARARKAPPPAPEAAAV